MNRREEYEKFGRRRKVNGLAVSIDKAVYEILSKANYLSWQAFAQYAGVLPPSPTTIKALLKRYQRRTLRIDKKVWPTKQSS